MITQMPLMVSSRHTNRSFDLVAWSQGKVTPEKLTIVGTMDVAWKKYRLLSRSCEAFLEALRARVGEEQ